MDIAFPIDTTSKNHPDHSMIVVRDEKNKKSEKRHSIYQSDSIESINLIESIDISF